MTPEQIGEIIKAVILALIGAGGVGGGATLLVRRRDKKDSEKKYTAALEKNDALNERLDKQDERIRQLEIDKAARLKEIDKQNGQLELLGKQLVEQEQRHTQEMMAVATERETFKQTTAREISELQEKVASLQREVTGVRRRNDELERINHLLEDRQAECDDYEKQVYELQRKLDASLQREESLQRVIDKLARKKTDPLTPSPEDPPTVDLPVQPKNDA